MAHRGRYRAYPYYKVQARDPKLGAWRDHRREAFDRLDEALAYQASVPAGLELRLMEWREDGSHVLGLEEIGARR